ncbi:MAG: helix-turn-helix domain-containing protein [Magnetococcales bacterium]|nr:helix-turn-helix domain-containing protein [Magnetococcales bacterium]
MTVLEQIEAGEPVFTIEEVAERLRKPTDYIRRIVRAGRIPVIKIGKRSQLVLRRDLDAFIEQAYQE